MFPPGEKELLFFIVRTTDDTKLLLRDTADLFGATRQMIYWASGHMRDKLIAAVKPQPIAQSIPPADLTEEPPWDIGEFAKLYRQTEQRRAIDNFITTMLKFQQSCGRVLQAGGVSSLEKQVMAPPPPPAPPRWWARPWRALCWLRRQGRRFINWLQS